ncbi:HRAS-like suppressor 2 [Scomber scombrus]|uniref:HRAS-like suppressor 2 n=1 Tax=Scomber scombrus TaxID=13677 RepID=A0AAV1P8W2_SCOSC
MNTKVSFDEEPAAVEADNDERFGTLNGRTPQVDNYLDDTIRRSPDEVIRGRIEEMIIGCGDFQALTNNCEHLATYVRYGRPRTNQILVRRISESMSRSFLAYSGSTLDLVSVATLCDDVAEGVEAYTEQQRGYCIILVYATLDGHFSTAVKMRSLILVAVILQLTVIIIESNGYEFGDIISFSRKCCGKPLYKHYAVYVGNEDFDGKEPGQDIFHHTSIKGNGKMHKKAVCVFGELQTQGKHQLDNYLDGTMNKLPDEDIKEHIKELMTKEGCGRYNPLKNNCEHLATYVRYGEKITKQVSGFFSNLT